MECSRKGPVLVMGPKGAEMRPHTAVLDSTFHPFNLDDGLDDFL